MSKNKSLTYFLFYMSNYIPLQFVDKLVNTYLFFNKEYKFCMEYEFSGKKAFTDYESELTDNEYYVQTIDTSLTNVVYVFDIPEPLFQVLELFVEGKYGALPMREELKDFLRKHFALPQNHKINHILDRSDELRATLEEQLGVVLPPDIDLAEPPNINNEEINFKN